MAAASQLREGGALPDIKLVLKWRQTFDGNDDDFVATSPQYSEPVGRIYLNRTLPVHHVDRWFWSMTAHKGEVSRNAGETSGFAATPREAGKRLEDAWFAAIRGTSLDRPTPTLRRRIPVEPATWPSVVFHLEG